MYKKQSYKSKIVSAKLKEIEKKKKSGKIPKTIMARLKRDSC